MDNIRQHKELLDKIHETYKAKNADYGDSFTKSFDKYGIICALVRMEDKWNRLNKLSGSYIPKVEDESIKDTLLDLANYAIMTYMEVENREIKADNNIVKSRYIQTNPDIDDGK